MESLSGRIVRSCAGRDKGNFLVVIRADECFVYVADGKERKLASPKKKSLKHVKLTNTVIDTESLTDKKLRSVILEYSTASKF
ncbi:KOW domain-containing RNA-binding protein [Huintestinicola sp.]|uniref:KOW domain-containing RNA-binding protein n=1 Tax=Huintestinicola sp. TaxID=2981661 RepID=UPI003D7C888B